MQGRCGTTGLQAFPKPAFSFFLLHPFVQLQPNEEFWEIKSSLAFLWHTGCPNKGDYPNRTFVISLWIVIWSAVCAPVFIQNLTQLREQSSLWNSEPPKQACLAYLLKGKALSVFILCPRPNPFPFIQMPLHMCYKRDKITALLVKMQRAEVGTDMGTVIPSLWKSHFLF